MNIKRFNLVISTVLLIPYAVRADARLETLDASGTTCTTKLSLCELDPSTIIRLGLKGDKGDKGDTGDCACGEDGEDNYEDDESIPGEYDKRPTEKEAIDWGTPDIPGKTTCKNAPIDRSGTYYLYNSMKVTCDVNMKTTCIVIEAKPSTASFSEIKPSWISSTGLEYKDIYNLSYNQIAWLQARSETASIKIRYYCYNTMPAHSDTPVLLLSWNDAIIGPKPTPSSPIHYKVQYDGCSSVAKNTWAYTDIVIKNTSAYRLPIIDFYIQDIAKDQQHKITVTELCFH